jgi:hypothetical protein
MNQSDHRTPASIIVVALVLWATLSGAASARTSPDNPCDDPSSSPSPAYSLPAYTTGQTKAMLKRPADVAGLLQNLKVVFDKKLLVQPSFFADSVLLELFDGRGLEWVKPGTADVMNDRIVKPTRIARISSDAPLFRGMKVDVGLNHKCLNRRTDPRDPHATIAPHTYDSGYIRLRFEPIPGLTLGAVRHVFGPNPGYFGVLCNSPTDLSYPTGSAGLADADTFFYNGATFYLQPDGYEDLCKSNPGGALPDEFLITGVLIRLVEEDHTIGLPPVL